MSPPARRQAEVRSVVDRDYADYTSDVVLGSRREQVRAVSFLFITFLKEVDPDPERPGLDKRK
jgi:hypothetical protein